MIVGEEGHFKRECPESPKSSKAIGGVGKPVIIVGKKATSRENALKVPRLVRPLVGVGEELLQEVTEKLRIVRKWKLC